MENALSTAAVLPWQSRGPLSASPGAMQKLIADTLHVIFLFDPSAKHRSPSCFWKRNPLFELLSLFWIRYAFIGKRSGTLASRPWVQTSSDVCSQSQGGTFHAQSLNYFCLCMFIVSTFLSWGHILCSFLSILLGTIKTTHILYSIYFSLFSLTVGSCYELCESPCVSRICVFTAQFSFLKPYLYFEVFHKWVSFGKKLCCV